jgi:hypothetical protein
LPSETSSINTHKINSDLHASTNAMIRLLKPYIALVLAFVADPIITVVIRL